MNRPSFRMGLALGLLGGAAAAVAKALQGQREASSPPVPAPATDWPPLSSVAPSPVPPTPAPAPPGPAAPAPRAEPLLGDAPPPPAPAPEPTFGTAPDPSSAAAARVPVATPIEAEESDPLPVPERPSRRTDSTTAPPTGRKGADKKAPAPRSAPAKKRAPAKRAVPTSPWVDPDGATCPGSHPVKGKLSSRIFHLPGMFAYDRTNPDRCYVDAAAAEADGLRAAKR